MVRKQENINKLATETNRVLRMVFGDDVTTSCKGDPSLLPGDYCVVTVADDAKSIRIDAYIAKPAIEEETGTHGYLKVMQNLRVPSTIKTSNPGRAYERWLIRQLFSQLRHYIMTTDLALELFPFLRSGSIRSLPVDDRTVWSGSSDAMKSAPVFPVLQPMQDLDPTVPF